MSGLSRRAALALCAAAFGGCLDRALEGPYVLAVGLDDARSVTLTPDVKALRVAGPNGVFDISPEGAVERVGPAAAAITSSPRRCYAIDGVRLTDATAPVPFGALPVGARDLVAIDGGLVTLGDTGLTLLRVPEVPHDLVVPTPVRAACVGADARGIALGRGSDEVIVVSERALTAVRIASDGSARCETLASGVLGARAAAVDAAGRVYVVADEDPALYRLDPSGPTIVARWLGDVRDAHFGAGVFPAENLYFIDGEGRITYVRPPPPAPTTPG